MAESPKEVTFDTNMIELPKKIILDINIGKSLEKATPEKYTAKTKHKTSFYNDTLEAQEIHNQTQTYYYFSMIKLLN